MTPDPLFVLGAPHSHASIICAALGQHPECYGLPSTNLFIADSLGDVWDALPDLDRHGRDGLKRAVAQLAEGAQTEEAIDKSVRWIDQRRDWQVSKVFEFFREAAGPRTLIEASPVNTAKPEYLRRMHTLFPAASFLHVTYHPLAMCDAMLEHAASPDGDEDATDLSVDPEKVWLNAHHNILDLASRLPLAQMMQIKAEDILSSSSAFLPQIALWLQVSEKSRDWRKMLRPERSDYARRGPRNAPLGVEPEFLASPALPPEPSVRAAGLPRTGGQAWREGEEFGKQAIKFARQFGYR